MKKNKQEKNQFIIIFILLSIIAVFSYLYYDKNKNGFLQVTSLDESLVFYIDNIKKESQTDINQKFKIEKGDHAVIVYKEGHWPWVKEIKISEQKITQIHPFFIPQNSSGFIIGNTDPEYYNILALFEQNLISNEAYNKIPTLEIKNQIKAINFYKNRDDVILMALAEGVYALGVDYEKEQNLQPIYKGINPIFVKKMIIVFTF